MELRCRTCLFLTPTFILRSLRHPAYLLGAIERLPKEPTLS